ncbi:hypothetical protein EVAR_31516_1 [Eumeta japonica]|uniref:Uncharacterized protein n=1 Tax=Eumeta variegata TaxID=151549 RepID=A0A4C1Z2C8_EUMVA|nr:hypothetical protein EVAR_31516_1 [Eumeta japonica]
MMLKNNVGGERELCRQPCATGVTATRTFDIGARRDERLGDERGRAGRGPRKAKVSSGPRGARGGPSVRRPGNERCAIIIRGARCTPRGAQRGGAVTCRAARRSSLAARPNELLRSDRKVRDVFDASYERPCHAPVTSAPSKIILLYTARRSVLVYNKAFLAHQPFTRINRHSKIIIVSKVQVFQTENGLAGPLSTALARAPAAEIRTIFILNEFRSDERKKRAPAPSLPFNFALRFSGFFQNEHDCVRMKIPATRPSGRRVAVASEGTGTEPAVIVSSSNRLTVEAYLIKIFLIHIEEFEP